MTTQTRNDSQQLKASFRDPSGFLFTQQGALYRQVNWLYREQYDRLVSCGLYEKLVQAGLLIPHWEVSLDPPEPSLAYRVIRPEKLDFVSYPYEWSFGMLRDAALATLDIQKQALAHGMVLKDSSAYNIQFHHGQPTLIDTLSFEIYREGEPWIAYRQFCQHFLAPLALMAHRDVRLGQLLRIYIDGVPLDLAAELLPFRTRFNIGLNLHLHLHAAAQKRYAGKVIAQTHSRRHMSRVAFLGLMDSLENTVRHLNWEPSGTEWADYYATSSGHYSVAAFEHKRQLVTQFIEAVAPQSVWDLGANTGEFSRLASERGIPTVAFDIDPATVELNYRAMRQKREKCLLPLVLDLTNPSPAMGWHHRERQSLLERGPADLVLALALIHHLAIANNVPLLQLADFFAQVGKWLVIEFVPKDDSQTQRLLASRQDIFSNYTQAGFETAFGQYFAIHRISPLPETKRLLYLMERK